MSAAAAAARPADQTLEAAGARARAWDHVRAGLDAALLEYGLSPEDRQDLEDARRIAARLAQPPAPQP